jgi:hypothetical protein
MSRFHLSPAMVVACAALVVALGGSAYAVSALPKNSVGTKQLKKGAVTTPKLAKHSVTGAKVKASTLGEVPLATTARSAQPAAFAFVDGSAAAPAAPTVTNAKGLTAANITHPATGVYCISGTAFPIKGGQVTPQFGGSYNVTAYFSPPPVNNVNCGTAAQVVTGAATGGLGSPFDERFNLVLYG